MKFYFCEKCRKRLSSDDLVAGKAVDKQAEGVFCEECASLVDTVGFETAEIRRLERKRDLRDYYRPTAEADVRADERMVLSKRSVFVTMVCLGALAALTLGLIVQHFRKDAGKVTKTRSGDASHFKGTVDQPSGRSTEGTSSSRADAGKPRVQSTTESDASTEPNTTPRETEKPLNSPITRKSLILHFAFDEGTGEKAGDASGNGFDGELHHCTWTQGVRGGAVSFEPRGDLPSFVKIPHPERLRERTGGDFSISVWCKPRSRPGQRAKYATIVKFRGLLIYTMTARFVFSYGFRAKHRAFTPAFEPGTFRHLVGVVDRKSGELRLHVNGKLAETKELPPSTKAPGAREEFLVGATRAGAGEFGVFHGVVDDLRIYDRGLTAGEIAALYAAAEE